MHSLTKVSFTIIFLLLALIVTPSYAEDLQPPGGGAKNPLIDVYWSFGTHGCTGCWVCERVWGGFLGRRCANANGESGRCWCETKDYSSPENAWAPFECFPAGYSCYGIIVTP